MKYMIKPDQGEHWFPSPYRSWASIPAKLQRYLVIEWTRSKEEAGPSAKVGEFILSNKLLRTKHGKGFNPKRLRSGQVVGYYLVEHAIDRHSVYVAKALDKVSRVYLL